MKIVYTDQFKHDLQKIKDNNVQKRVLKVVQKLIDNPNIGKPLKYDLVGLRSVRVSAFRIVYEMKDDTMILHKFQHRKIVYK